MKELGLLISRETEPVYNVALEDALLDAVVAGELPPLLRLWRNEPCVVLGANRKVSDDVFLDRVREDKLPLVRRRSGGGTVYHDLDNFNLSLILRVDHTPGAETIPSSIELFCGWICAILRMMGLEGEKTRISDVSVNGRKISGHAQARRRGFLLHHATILNRVDFQSMRRYLKLPPERPAIEHGDFLTSLEELGAALTFDEFIARAAEETTRFFTLERPYTPVSAGSLPDAGELVRDRYSRDEWTFRR